jgi:hypothetical protein
MRHLFTIPLAIALALPASAQTPTKEDAKAFVQAAAASLQKNGREKFLMEVSSPKGAFHFAEQQNKGLYIFVYDEKGTVLAHGARVELVGQHRWEAKDPDGKPWIQDWTKLVQEKGSGYIAYKEFNPAAGNKIMNKVSFVALKEGMVIGCGVYQ